MKKIAILGIVLGLFLGGCGAEKSDEVLKIGGMFAISGEVAPFGVGEMRGAEIAFDEVNENGGVEMWNEEKGLREKRQIEFVVEDTACDGKKAVTGFLKLMDWDGVKYFVGPSCDMEILAIAPQIDQKGAFLAAPGASKEIPGAADGLVSLWANAFKEGELMAEKIIDLGKKRAALFFHFDDYYIEIADGFREKFEELGGDVVYEVHWEDWGKGDFRTELLLAKEKGIDVLVAQTVIFNNQVLVKQSEELGMEILIVVNSDNFGEDFKGVGEGLILPYFVFDNEAGDLQEFLEEYRERYEEEPNVFIASIGYDIAKILVAALENTNGEPVKMREWIMENEHEGLTGKMVFADDGTVLREYEWRQLKGGEFMKFED